MISDQTLPQAKQSHNEPQAKPTPISNSRKIWLYLARALNLRCPLCGQAPIFPPFYQYNGPVGWFKTLSRCSHCDCNFYRESGYFLIVAWFINVEVYTVFGVLGFIAIDRIIHLSFIELLFFNSILILMVSLLTIRHAKALFIALDYLVDPPRESEETNRPR